MSAPKNQPHVTAQEMIDQSRWNRRQAAVLESRNGPQDIEKRVPAKPLRPALMVPKSVAS